MDIIDLIGGIAMVGFVALAFATNEFIMLVPAIVVAIAMSARRRR